MITLKQNCKDGAKYFQYRKKNTFIRVYVKLNKDKNSYCDIYSNRQQQFLSPPSKVFYGEDCLHQAYNSYKHKTYKKAIKTIIEDIKVN
nr:hypothetical protein [uncultured Mediterranean phage uvMED]BAR26575.1 hypothetical protein [uncultured Mediterranean phage uvMED]BAR26630.1 hypothetical protein [uncultured Mediterranean phage uvMED]BAR26684.1 hypothetical protein [uncultured Mediterranean phage uvMED]BAR26717.1 hypothetical protein [uncultured Mediterranean phage uvMED]|tara:strand:- start:3611 stop:3877 length:267 start_codon:yes stop_codon:yes gene_type:complete